MTKEEEEEEEELFITPAQKHRTLFTNEKQMTWKSSKQRKHLLKVA